MNRKKQAKAAETTRLRYGQDFFRRIGQLGGQKGWPEGVQKGFAKKSSKKLARKR